MTASWRAGIGAGGWLVYAGWRGLHPAPEVAIAMLTLFAALVLVPLVFELNADPEEVGGATRPARWARRLQLPAAALLVPGCVLPPGLAAAAAALPWAVFGALLAITGWQRAAAGGWGRGPGRLCADAALLFAGLGGVGFLVNRAGWRPAGLAPADVAIVALHFHYAGLVLPTLTGLVLRRFPEARFAATAGVGVVLGVPAVGIALLVRRLGGGAEIEGAAGCGLALSGMAIGILYVRMATEGFGSKVARGLWGVAGAALFFGMVLAGLHAMRGFARPFPWLDAPRMFALHGLVNAFGFGLCGALGWRLASRTSGRGQSAGG